MGYRYRMRNEKADEHDFRTMEVVIVRKKDGQEISQAQVVTLDNHYETLKYVQENMGDFVANIVRVKRMETAERQTINDNVNLFERNLEPLFSHISQTCQEHVLDKLSLSLKKALLLMAMDRYQCNQESVCRALGLSPERLQQELTSCGLASAKI